MPRDAWSLKSLLPPRLLSALRRLRELTRKARRLHLNRPKARREAALQEVAALESRPLISLAMPTYKSDLGYLGKAIDSVLAQHYPEWELCIVDDGSGQPELVAAVERYARADSRISCQDDGTRDGASTSPPPSRRARSTSTRLPNIIICFGSGVRPTAPRELESGFPV